MARYILGTKYYTYDKDGNRETYRLIKAKSDKVVLLNETNKTSIIVEDDTFKKNYMSLIPDAIMTIVIAEEPTEMNDTANIDVYVNIKKRFSFNKDETPDMVLRQNIFSSTKNMNGDFMSGIYVGDIVTMKTSSKEQIVEFVTFIKTKYEDYIALYIDDTVDNIIECVSSKTNKMIESALSEIKSIIGDISLGCCDTFKELLESNNFNEYYNDIFNIVRLDFPIDLGESSYNEDDDIILNDKQLHNLQYNVLNKYIDNVKVIKYDKDLDIGKIVMYEHIMVIDSDNKMYLIAFNTLGYITTTTSSDNTTVTDDSDVLEMLKRLL